MVEVSPPVGYSFHPKIWVLRFEHEDEPVRYRMLCMTRNLTFDRSWDTMLVLDGELMARKMAIAVINPDSPTSSTPYPPWRSPGPGVSERDNVRTAADALRRVKFDAPEGFDGFAFHPLGIDNISDHWPSRTLDRLLIMSPFLTDGTVDALADQAGETTLISRTDALDGVPPAMLENLAHVYGFPPRQHTRPAAERRGRARRRHCASGPARQTLRGRPRVGHHVSPDQQTPHTRRGTGTSNS